MKSACKSLKTSIICTSLFLLVTIIMSVAVVNYDSIITNIILNISIGFLGSSFVALLLSIPSYLVAKRQVLERYWDSSRLLIKNISKIKYLDCNYNIDNMIGYIHEKNNKIMYEKLKIKDVNSKLKEYEDKLIDEYLAKNKVDKKYAKVIVEKEIEDFRKETKEVCLQYIEAADNYSTSQLSFLLGDIEFISGRNEYINLHKNLYQPFHDLLDDICSEAYHFRLFINNEGNEAVVIEKVLNLQNKIYRKEYKEKDKYTFENLFNDFRDKMLIKLEDFRAMIYNIAPEDQKIYPIYSRIVKK